MLCSERAVPGGQRGRGRRALAAVEPPAAHAEPHQLAVRRPPPGPHRRIREIEVPLALPVVGDAAGGSLVPRRQQIAARLGLGEQRRCFMEHRVLVGDDLEVLLAHLVEQRLRLRPQLGLELEVSHAAVPARAPRRRSTDRSAHRTEFASREWCAGAGAARRCRRSGAWTAESQAPSAAAAAGVRAARSPRPGGHAGRGRSGSTTRAVRARPCRRCATPSSERPTAMEASAGLSKKSA